MPSELLTRANKIVVSDQLSKKQPIAKNYLFDWKKKTSVENFVFQNSSAKKISNKIVFESLSSNWLSETLYLSDSERIYSNSSYLRILEMGDAVVPFIFEKLQVEPQHWFHALQTILGQNPVKVEHYGRISAMTNDWIQFLVDYDYGRESR